MLGMKNPGPVMYIDMLTATCRDIKISLYMCGASGTQLRKSTRLHYRDVNSLLNRRLSAVSMHVKCQSKKSFFLFLYNSQTIKNEISPNATWASAPPTTLTRYKRV